MLKFGITSYLMEDNYFLHQNYFSPSENSPPCGVLIKNCLLSYSLLAAVRIPSCLVREVVRISVIVIE